MKNDAGPQTLAGLFDGEGCIVIAKWCRTGLRWKSVYHALVVNIVNTHRPVLDWLVANFGGVVRPKPRKPGVKQVYVWTIGGNVQGSKFLKAVRPWLIIKAFQAWLALEYTANCANSGNKARVSDEELALRDGFHLALQEAKK